jgi:hypothetical protein
MAIIVGAFVIDADAMGTGSVAEVLPPAPPQAVRASKPSQSGEDESRIMDGFLVTDTDR